MKRFMLICIIIFLASCGVTKPQVQENVYKSTTTREVLKDTVVNITSDVSQAVYGFEIRNDTIRAIDTIETNKGNYLDAPSVVIKDNKLIVTARQPAHKIRVQYIEIYRIDTVMVDKRETITHTTNELNGWQNFNYWTGMIVWGLVAIAIIGYLVLLVLRLKGII